MRAITSAVVVAIAGLGMWGGDAVGQAVQGKTDVAPAPSVRFPAEWYPPDSDVTSIPEPVKGVPYSGTMVTTGFYKNDKTGEVVGKFTEETFQVRDGEGRTRSETRTQKLGPDVSGKLIEEREVSVEDPVSHCSFRWVERATPGEPTAVANCLSRKLRYMGSADMWASAMKRERTEEHPAENETVVTEPLGTRSMEGLTAEGMRLTGTTLMNPATKVERVVVCEIWYSPELREMLSLKREGGVAGRSESGPSSELKDIRRGEPDPALFYPPKGYRITNGS